MARFLLFFVLLSLSTASQAAVRFDVIVGYNGAAPKAAWFPITCELQNSGPSVNAIIEASSSQGETTRLALELPSNTQKRVVIPVFSGSGYRDWKVRLLSDKGKPIAEPSYIGPHHVSGIPILGVMSRTATSLPTLPSTRILNPEIQPIAVRLQPELFPDNPIALDGLQTLYLSSERAPQLSVPQVNALLAWVQRGGHLVVGIEQVTDIAAAEWLNKMMPCELSANAVLKTHPEFEKWIADYAVRPSDARTPQPARRPTQTRVNRSGRPTPAPVMPISPETTLEDLKTVEPDPEFESTSLSIVTGILRDGKVILGNASAPLAIQAPRGRGDITVLTFSPEREPFHTWKNRGWFWAKVAGIPSETFRSTSYNGASNGFNTDGAIGAMIDSKQIRKLSVGWLMVLLGAYLIVIGPLDHYCLKKLNRQMLTWITFPIYVVGFSGLIYIIGFHLRAGDLEYNQLDVVDVLPGNQLTPSYPETNEAACVTGENAILRGESYCSIYSPANDKYPLAGDQPFATLRNEFTLYDANLNSHAAINQRGNGFQAETFVPIWTPQLVVSDWLQPAPLPLNLKVQLNAQNNWIVSVENKTTRPFPRAHIVLSGRLFELGSLPAQKTSTFTLVRERGTMLNDFANNLGMQLQNAANSRRQSFGKEQVGVDFTLGSIATSFTSLFNNANDSDAFLNRNGLDLTDKAMHGNGVLFVWDADHSFTSQINRFSARRLHRDTLLRLVFPLQQQKVNAP